MIVDCHTHVGRNQHIGATADQLLHSMDIAGIDKSLVLAGKLNDASNDWMLEQIAPHKDRLIGVAAAHPHLFDLDEFKKIEDLFGEGKIAACKFYVGYHHYFPNDHMCWNYLAMLNRIGCPAIFHSGDCLCTVSNAKLKYAHPLHIDEVAVDFPNMNFVIAHMGYPWQRDAAEVCYKNKNVFADISGFVYGSFDQADIDKFKKVVLEFADIAGTKKLLFGTDWPISDQKSYMAVKELLAFDELFIEADKVFKL